MSGVVKQSGAKKRKIKRDQLIKEVASRPGQLKISNIFKSSVASNCIHLQKNVTSDIVVDDHVQYMEDDVASANTKIHSELEVPSESIEEIEECVNDKDKLASSTHAVAELPSEMIDTSTHAVTELPSEMIDTSTHAVTELPSEMTDMSTHAVAELPSGMVDMSTHAVTELPSEMIDMSTHAVAELPSEMIDTSTHTVTEIPSEMVDASSPATHPKLTIDWFLRNYDCLRLSKVNVNGKTRPFMHCNVCEQYESVAKATSRNGCVYMAKGVRVDSRDKLERLFNHLNGKSHQDAALAKRNTDLWNLQSEDHIWRKYLNTQHRELIELLLRMAMDVYNDSLCDTIPAWNWPSRSLTQCRSNQFVDALSQEGFDSVLPPFQPSESLLRYRNPVAYAEMLDIIYTLEVEKIASKVNNSICYCLMVDGSIDRSRCDNKFVCARYIEPDASITSVFLSVVEPEQSGAKGLLEAVMTSLSQTKVDRKKMASVTTDGEPANTGRHGGLWALLEKELNQKLLTIWCNCHRSDLAMEELEELVPELKIWKNTVLTLTNYFKTSKCNSKLLEEYGEKMGITTLSFPKHFDVRFAEHLHAILKTIFRNLPACKKVWVHILNSKDHTAREKSKASDLLNIWRSDSLQYLLTGLMSDITAVFTSLQKGLQKPYLILPDVLTLRDAAIRKFEIMTSGALTGGFEEKCEKAGAEKDITIRSHFQSEDSDNEKYYDLRSTILITAKNVLSRRLNIENDSDNAIDSIKNITTASTCSELVKSSVNALKLFLDNSDESGEEIRELIDDICDQWTVLSDIPALITSDVGSMYSTRLRNMFVKSKGRFQWLLGVFLVSSPHNMGTERVISHHNKIKSIYRQSSSEETMTKRLIISINGIGTAHYDPRPAVIKFLQSKDRRFRSSDLELYENRDFVKKFFRCESTV